ncbi:hypothetical protein A6A05_00405 [Magnetospirillum moscoviense]|uniref:Glycosyltransferase subfamily 4-like N-terminal domain-containing protein n=2 Tax=Magnetospirillum moscoviense TaxID=1437059 RepID=A0A178MWD3_9PROT|nr:hypothetical protein A6A05_00405 [Magnetospirillum moscoviense]
MAACRWLPALAEPIYWSMAHNRAMAACACDIKADLFVANDWSTLPIACRLAETHRARFVYDSHEYAVEEGADRWTWRLLVSPFVRAIETRFIKDAAAVFTVGDRIAAMMQSDHGLRTAPLVVRNTVPLVESPFRPCGDIVEVLYQGLIRADRGLETLIRSVPLWRQEFRLRLRGPGEPAIVDHLKALAATLAADRIVFDPPVPPSDMVAAANRSDVGIHPIPPISNQSRYCLPNKFFEYAMAGLALCVSDSDEMTALLRRHALGHVIDADTPHAIAEAINSFDRPGIDAAKRRAIEASRHLCWENERAHLISAFAALGDG